MQQQRTCTEDGCDGSVIARGWCHKHYSRWQRSRPEDRARNREYDRKRRSTPEYRASERKRNKRRSAYQQAWADARHDWGSWWERQRRIEDRQELRVWRPKVWPRCKLSKRPLARLFISRYCVACGASWVSYAAMPDTDYCSPCNERRWKDDCRHKRRVRMGTAVEVFSAEEVFRRDRYRCQLCGYKTRGKYPHPRSPTVDHIVPLSLGGDHSLLNVQCACLECNTRKGRGAANDQLRLVA